MTTPIKFETATPAEVEEIIAQARRMRSAYISRSIKAGLSNLRGTFARKRPAANVAA